jgi:hypothetical protein
MAKKVIFGYMAKKVIFGYMAKKVIFRKIAIKTQKMNCPLVLFLFTIE